MTLQQQYDPKYHADMTVTLKYFKEKQGRNFFGQQASWSLNDYKSLEPEKEGGRKPTVFESISH